MKPIHILLGVVGAIAAYYCWKAFAPSGNLPKFSSSEGQILVNGQPVKSTQQVDNTWSDWGTGLKDLGILISAGQKSGLGSLFDSSGSDANTGAAYDFPEGSDVFANDSSGSDLGDTTSSLNGSFDV